MDNLWRALPDFPADLFTDGYVLPKLTIQRCNYLDVDGLLSPAVLDWFRSRGLTVRNGAVLFNYVLKGLGTAHRDFDQAHQPMWSAINVELCGSSLFHFYEHQEATEVIRRFNVDFARYDYTKMKRLGTLAFPEPYKAYLVNIGYPHQAECVKAPRRLLTLRFSTANSHSPTWDESVQAIFGRS